MCGLPNCHRNFTGHGIPYPAFFCGGAGVGIGVGIGVIRDVLFDFGLRGGLLNYNLVS
jgi:hypothetical protein